MGGRTGRYSKAHPCDKGRLSDKNRGSGVLCDVD